MMSDRPGNKRIGEGTIAGADTATDPTTVLDPMADLPFEAERLELQYDGGATVTADVEIHDEATSTAGGDFGAPLKTVKGLAAGDTVTLKELGVAWPAFEQAIRVLPDGNQDAEIVVTASGLELTISG